MRFNLEKYMNIQDVCVEKDEITINRMNHPATVSNFIKGILRSLDSGIKDFKFIWNGTTVFPNACVPISGIIQFLEREKGVTFDFDIPPKDYLINCGFVSPFKENAENNISNMNPFDKIFEYNNSNQVAKLTQNYIDTISRSAECDTGVIDSLTWCLNETMDNVLVHSRQESGFVMAQFHPSTMHVAVCIYDSGVGIYKTLSNSHHRPLGSLDAISLAIQEGVGDGKGQGNGLYGLSKIIENNYGQLTITSKDASIMFRPNEEMKRFDRLPFLSKNNSGTIIDFQIDLNRSVDLKTIFAPVGGFDGFDIRLDNMWEEDKMTYNVWENCNGTATREAGKEVRFDVLNTLKRSNAKMQLDFTDVRNVSSSFIDEFIAKIVLQFGIVKFNKYFEIKGMNETIELLCNRSILMRFHDNWEQAKKAKNV